MDVVWILCGTHIQSIVACYVVVCCVVVCGVCVCARVHPFDSSFSALTCGPSYQVIPAPLSDLPLPPIDLPPPPPPADEELPPPLPVLLPTSSHCSNCDEEKPLRWRCIDCAVADKDTLAHFLCNDCNITVHKVKKNRQHVVDALPSDRTACFNCDEDKPLDWECLDCAPSAEGGSAASVAHLCDACNTQVHKIKKNKSHRVNRAPGSKPSLAPPPGATEDSDVAPALAHALPPPPATLDPKGKGRVLAQEPARTGSPTARSSKTGAPASPTFSGALPPPPPV